jgi:chloride channel 3/4/5
LFAKPDSEVLLEKSRYENFHTIDWLKDLAKDRYRRRWIREKDESGYVIEKLQHWHDAISGWFCVLLVAICTAITAGLIDISFKWMSNLKSGVCKDTFWLDREQCCWDAKDANRDIYQNVNCSKVTKRYIKILNFR